MKIVMKLSVLILLMATATSALAWFFWIKPKEKTAPVKAGSHKTTGDDPSTILRLKQKALLAADFVRENNFNTTRCFLVDMRLASGKERFFVYNLKNDMVENAGLVAHGSGSDKGGDELCFSNTPNSNCTSLGRYKIGKSYMGTFGLAYKLHGLDNTNSRAFERFVVLHAHSCVPGADVYPSEICQSWGCPTVSPAFLSVLKTYIDKSAQPILLWIYY